MKFFLTNLVLVILVTQSALAKEYRFSTLYISDDRIYPRLCVEASFLNDKNVKVLFKDEDGFQRLKYKNKNYSFDPYLNENGENKCEKNKTPLYDDNWYFNFWIKNTALLFSKTIEL